MSDLDPDIDCERWAEIADRRLVDEDVSEEDATFARDHAASCPFCGAEAHLYDELDPSADSLTDESAKSIVDRALAKKLPLRTEPKPEPKPASAAHASHDSGKQNASSYLAGAVGAALALAAGVALMLTGVGERASASVVGKLGSATGDVRVNGAPVQPGTDILLGARIDVGNGTACVDFTGSDHARSCLDAESTLVIEKAEASKDVISRYSLRQILLARGTVVTGLDSQRPGHRFEVVARDTKTTVTGTIFSVTLQKRAQVTVRVHEGSVRTEAPAVQRPIPTNNELDVTTNQLARIPYAVREHELELLGRRIARAGSPSVRPTPTLRIPNLVPPSNTSPTEPAVPSASATPAEMLATARKLRTQGNSAGAADAYRKLMLVHPRSAEANAAQLSLAELQLGPLGDPSGALRSYDTYLRSGGGLSQEARYGRILALRRLGRAAEERAAIEQFIQSYPSSVQARALEQRLKSP